MGEEVVQPFAYVSLCQLAAAHKGVDDGSTLAASWLPTYSGTYPFSFPGLQSVYTEPIIQNFLSFIDHMSCSTDTYVSLGGSNGCADQLTNWDGTQKLGLGASPKKKSQGLSR